MIRLPCITSAAALGTSGGALQASAVRYDEAVSPSVYNPDDGFMFKIFTAGPVGSLPVPGEVRTMGDTALGVYSPRCCNLL
jgi:hypothetical protein